MVGNPKIKTGAYSLDVNLSGNGLDKLANKELNVSEKRLNIVSIKYLNFQCIIQMLLQIIHGSFHLLGKDSGREINDNFK